MSKKQKCTKIEKETRLFTVAGWLINSVPEYIILKNCTEPPPKGWGLTQRQAKRYLEEAYASFRQQRHDDLEERRLKKIAELENRNRTMKDAYRGTPAGMNAMRLNDELIAKLEGMITKTNVHKHQGGGPNAPPIQTALRVEVIHTGAKIATSEDDVDI